MSIYSVFYNKLPSNYEFLLPDEKGRVITFLNPYYLERLKEEEDLYQKFDYICSDGLLPIILNRLWGKNKSIRISFDMTSLAKKVFEWLSESEKGVYFIGSTSENLEKFIATIKRKYALNINGFHHGYIKNNFSSIAQNIIDSDAEVVIIGMGAPLQDKFAIFLKQQGFKGTVYTCGGFLHQTTERLNYYPKWINYLNLRTPYRLLHERYVWRRVWESWPRFLINYSLFLIKMEK